MSTEISHIDEKNVVPDANSQDSEVNLRSVNFAGESETSSPYPTAIVDDLEQKKQPNIRYADDKDQAYKSATPFDKTRHMSLGRPKSKKLAKNQSFHLEDPKITLNDGITGALGDELLEVLDFKQLASSLSIGGSQITTKTRELDPRHEGGLPNPFPSRYLSDEGPVVLRKKSILNKEKSINDSVVTPKRNMSSEPHEEQLPSKDTAIPSPSDAAESLSRKLSRPSILPQNAEHKTFDLSQNLTGLVRKIEKLKSKS